MFKMHKLEAKERPSAIYTIYVRGRGEFPLDMLRYDGAWPVRSEDAYNISLKGRHKCLK